MNVPQNPNFTVSYSPVSMMSTFSNNGFSYSSQSSQNTLTTFFLRENLTQEEADAYMYENLYDMPGPDIAKMMHVSVKLAKHRNIMVSKYHLPSINERLKVLPTIIFFSSLMSVLYYVGAMQKLVGAISLVMQKTLGTSGAETLSAAGNIFVGQTEAPLLVRPYLNSMTRSELMAVMVGGFATIAGGVMAAYVGLGVSPVHLLTASLMSAPAALVIAKIMQPEVDQPLTLGKVEITPPMEATNVIDAAARGASDGMTLALNVAAMLIAFLGLIYMLDSSLEAITNWISLKTTGTPYRLNFTQMMGWVSRPFAWLMGIENKDLPIAGEILGKRIVTNEFIAYLDISAKPQSADEAPAFSERTKTILTYALCGFANVGSIGIQIGGLGPLAPDRRADLVRLGVRAMIGGLLACYMTACLASILIP
jgi:CNT family concentrative nucleoside transporter